MGRSLSTCFKIMSCAGDSADGDGVLQTPESKTSPGKRRWSFQKRSALHNVPSNDVISESIPIANNKQNQAVAVDTANSISQKATVAEHTNETPTLPLAIVSHIESEQVTDKSTAKVDYNIQEDVVVVVQACIRGYLVKRELKKIKDVVKLQAAIRRYFVRRQAVGTLRCILAIVKIQQIIRARLAIRSTKFIAKEKFNEEMTGELVKSFEMKSNKTPPAIRKLASNAFASQLLKSTLKTKAFHISCNPLRPDSGWIWLERWMTLTSSDQQKNVLKQDDLNACEVNDKFQVSPEHISSASNLTPIDPIVPAEVENGSEMIELQVPASIIQEQFSNSPVQNHQLDSHGEETMSDKKNEYLTNAWVKESSDSVQSQILPSTDVVLDVELSGNSNKLHCSEEAHKNITKKEPHETPEMELDQVVIESRKSRNLGFAAVQAKFEVLSAVSVSNRSLSLAYQDIENDSKSVQSLLSSKSEEVREIKSVKFQAGTKFKEVRLTGNLAGHNPVNSTASILDKSEDELSESIPEDRTSKEKNCSVSSTSFNIGDLSTETIGLSSDSEAIRQQRRVMSSENTAEPVQVEQQPAESITSNTQVVGSAKGPHVDRSSLEGSPTSHITVPESHETPSSQISTNAKTTKTENSIPARKKRSQLVINSSPTDSKNDSDAQTSGEHLKKDTKSSKRRNSFSMIKTDHVDHEHQTGSGNLLPSYMQPTESARAKVNTSIYQKSSPDILESSNHKKKRNSLPSGDEKQGSSPRMQRSTSQVQQNLKGNAIHSPHNSAERRWLR